MSDNTKNWSLNSLKGTKEGVIARIEASESVPDSAKAFILEAINNSSFEGITVDAHCFFHNGATTIHASVVKLF